MVTEEAGEQRRRKAGSRGAGSRGKTITHNSAPAKRRATANTTQHSAPAKRRATANSTHSLLLVDVISD
ncbi:hypothetical protein [Nostoc sp. CMAA1605]|uniref:hypothetical protein n=1 Tax=Nostoc sp. CMAA1605 TaxID=2055159 RepID=UPI001F2088AD|nr:hypothetical protein [Nostoc sp. CMAA1605]MCF4970683.1 hypothetical protein [Nostoc sp. CMAA1605]